MSATKKGCLIALLLFFCSCIGLNLLSPFLGLPWGMMRERSRQGYDKFYHETVVSIWGGEPPASLHVVYAHDSDETLDWSWIGDISPHFRPDFIDLRMKVDAADLLPWMEKKKLKPIFFRLPENQNKWEGALFFTGVKRKNAYCGFRIPYSFNAPAVVDDVTSPTLIFAVRCKRSLALPSERQRALDLTTECLRNP
jgi:hypothetical protein